MFEEWTAVYLPTLEDGEQPRTRSGFYSETEAWNWIRKNHCGKSKKEWESRQCEWNVIRTEDFYSDNWREQATKAFASGTCPICFGDDEGGHRDGCYILELEDKVCSLEEEVTRYARWVDDLQSGMYINCVYCGHRYGPKETTPTSMAEVLRQHIEKCPSHPMSGLKYEIKELKKKIKSLEDKTFVGEIKEKTSDPYRVPNASEGLGVILLPVYAPGKEPKDKKKQ